MKLTTLALALALLSSVASAQPGATPPAPPPTEPPPSDTPPAPPPAPAADPRSDGGWLLYHDAFESFARNNRRKALTDIHDLHLRFPGHPAIAITDAAGFLDSPNATREQPEKFATAELALFQSFTGIATGIEFCVASDCGDGGAVIGLALLGGGLGAGISAVSGPFTSGHRALLNSGVAWLNIDIGIGLGNSSLSSTHAAEMLIGANVGGLVLGEGIDRGLHPTGGQVALANSGGFWTGWITGLLASSFANKSFDDHYDAWLIGSTTVGLAAGSVLAYMRPETTRGQTLVIDAAGLAGGVGGGALVLVITGDNSSSRAVTLTAAAGAVAGLAISAYLTRDWNDDDSGDPVPQAYIAPVQEGHGAIAGAGVSW
ncbi:MAG TPA: hypothetical protein VGM90_23260 [Kofleriaceae bacterium]